MSAIIPASAGFDRSLAHQVRAIVHTPAQGRGAPIAMHLVSSPDRFQLSATFIVAQLEEKNRAQMAPLARARPRGPECPEPDGVAAPPTPGVGRMALIIGPQFRGPEVKTAATTH